MSYSEMKALALDVVCDYCGAEPQQRCVTKSGGRARYMHWPRLWLIQRAWSLGYSDASDDLTRSYVNEPEWFDTYARREVERNPR